MGRLVPAVVVVALMATVVIAVIARPPSTSALAGVTWRWVGSTSGPAAQPSSVPDPARYTIDFLPDRRFKATADCATVQGRYVLIPPGRRGPLEGLGIERLPADAVSCGVDSLATAYVTQLDRAASYVVADGQLTITLLDGATMTFR